MATIVRRKNADRTHSYVVTVRISGFKSASKAFHDRDAAEEWAEELERSLKAQKQRGGLRHDATALTVSDIITEFKKDPAFAALRSAADANKLLDWWADHYGSVKCRELSVLRLREARELLTSTGERMVWNADKTARVPRPRAPATVQKFLAVMRSCWNWARRSGLVPVGHLWPPGLGVKLPRPKAKFLTDDELARIAKAAEVAGPLMNAAVTVSILTGIRQGELLGLTWANVDLDKATLRLLDTKNGESRAVYLPPPAVEVLRVLREQPVTSLKHVFVLQEGRRRGRHRANDPAGAPRVVPLDAHRLVSRWQRIQTAAHVTCNWHRLRHCAASYLLAAGATLAEVGSALGHKSTASTSRYAHLVQGRALPAHAAIAEKLMKARAAKIADGAESKS